MGTRADFYYEKEDKSLEWLGSIGWDGYPSGINDAVKQATDLQQYIEAVKAQITEDRGTFPEQGWPWPWEDSCTTDYSYVFKDGKTWGSNWGYRLFDPLLPEPDDDEDDEESKLDIWPNMKERQNIARDSQRSGIFIIGG